MSKYRIDSHGVDYPQYFPGHSAVHTEFDECVTGVGETEADALSDAIEQMCCGASEDRVLMFAAQIERESMPDMDAEQTAVQAEGLEDEEASEDAYMPQFYVSILYTL